MIYSSGTSGVAQYHQKPPVTILGSRTEPPPHAYGGQLSYTPRAESNYSLSQRSEQGPQQLLKSYSTSVLASGQHYYTQPATSSVSTTAHVHQPTVHHYVGGHSGSQVYHSQQHALPQPAVSARSYQPAEHYRTEQLGQQSMVDSLLRESSRLVAAALDYKAAIDTRTQQFEVLKRQLDLANACKSPPKSSLKKKEEAFTVEERDELLAIIEQQRAEIERLTKKKKKKAQEEEALEPAVEIKNSQETREKSPPKTKEKTKKIIEEQPVPTKEKEIHKSADLGNHYVKPKKRLAATKKL